MSLGLSENDPSKPKITPMANCHSCNELVQFGLPKCPYCGTLLDIKRLIPSTRENLYNTLAIAAANELRSLGLYLGIVLVVCVVGFMGNRSPSSFSLLLIIGFIQIIKLGIWFMIHGHRNSTDQAYLAARKKMKWIGALWLAATLLSGIALVITIKGK